MSVFIGRMTTRWLFYSGARLAGAVLLAALASATFAATPPDLSGTWVPDPSALPEMRIVQSGSRITLEFLEKDATVISATNLTTDGRESLNTRAGGALLHRSTSTWHGVVLRTVWKVEKNREVVMAGTDERELTAPDTLVVTTATGNSRSPSRSVIVYHRQAAAPAP